jgi:hypothetical protein
MLSAFDNPLILKQTFFSLEKDDIRGRDKEHSNIALIYEIISLDKSQEKTWYIRVGI